ncbi:MAG: Ig-like domain-containing protein, partial [Gaiellales bacterium]
MRIPDTRTPNGAIKPSLVLATALATLCGLIVPLAGAALAGGGATVTTITVTPASEANPTGTSHTATATVTDQSGDPVSGVNVDWRVTGRNTVTTNDTVTSASGKATLNYMDTGPAGSAGDDTIRACTDQVTEDDDCGGALDAGEVQDTAEKQWIP